MSDCSKHKSLAPASKKGPCLYKDTKCVVTSHRVNATLPCIFCNRDHLFISYTSRGIYKMASSHWCKEEVLGVHLIGARKKS